MSTTDWMSQSFNQFSDDDLDFLWHILSPGTPRLSLQAEQRNPSGELRATTSEVGAYSPVVWSGHESEKGVEARKVWEKVGRWRSRKHKEEARQERVDLGAA